MANDNRRGSGLDQPKDRARLARPSIDPETAGKVSERIARFLGSWRFIGYMTLFVIMWVLWNVLAPESLRFDTWPFIGLTLLLSLQASYAAPLILLAQNRQSDRDRIQYQEDRAQAERLSDTTEYLTREIASLRMSLGEVATRDFMRGELRDLIDEIESRLDGESGTDKADKRKKKPQA
jgi:uncharacterized membrane protein